MNKDSKIILGVGLGVILAGCGLFVYQQVQLLMKWCYKIKSVKFSNVSKSNVTINFIILFRNFSLLKIDISGFDIDLIIDGLSVSKIHSEKGQVVKPNSISQLDFGLQINPIELFIKDTSKLIKFTNSLLNKERMVITMRGFVYVKLYGIRLPKLNLDITMTYSEIMAEEEEPLICDIR